MKELNLDPELSYAVHCHADFEGNKNLNPGFVLTRTQTLMQGAEFCDFCNHDTNIKEEINHPPRKFWEQI